MKHPTTKFLLDANLSPKVGRYLTVRFGLDVYSLLEHGLGEIPDQEVLRFARSSGRVIITLDNDFTDPERLRCLARGLQSRN